MDIILGSKSPRRAEILSYFSLPFRQEDPLFDEDEENAPQDPKEHVLFLALEKAKSLSIRFEDSVIITADTTVYFQNRIYNKPKSEQEGFSYLEAFSNQWHTVYTAVTVYRSNTLYSDVELTRVLFNPISPGQIQKYFNALHCWDKAGGYSIQKCGHIVVNKIEGCFYNAMGLPINTLKTLLQKAGIDLWNYLKNSESHMDG